MTSMATHLITGAILAAVGFSGGAALSEASLAVRPGQVFDRAALGASAACHEEDDWPDGASQMMFRFAATTDEDAWCLLR